MSTTDDDPIAERLGLTPINSVGGQIIEHKTTNIVKSDAETELESDRQYARENLYQTIEGGNRALEQMLQIAEQSQHPRAFEVVATLMKTMVDANKDLVDMTAKKVAEQTKTEEPKQHTTNQLIFNGSTKDLLEYLNKKEK